MRLQFREAGARRDDAQHGAIAGLDAIQHVRPVHQALDHVFGSPRQPHIEMMLQTIRRGEIELGETFRIELNDVPRLAGDRHWKS